MRKEDFKKRQTVRNYPIGNAARGKKTKKERIKEYEVISIGRKYITVRPKIGGWDVKFEIENDFREVVTSGGTDHLLFLSKEDIDVMLERQEKTRFVQQAFRWEKRIYSKLSDEDLDMIVDIARKYTK